MVIERIAEPVDAVASILLAALRDALQLFFGRRKRSNRIEDPIAFDLLRSRVTSALFFGVLGIAVDRIGTKPAFSGIETVNLLQSWDLLRLGTRIPLYEDLKSLSPDVRSVIEQAWKNVTELQIVDLEQVEDIYEQVIAADFQLTDGKIFSIVAHEGRNRQGAFFTPDDLALQCVRAAIDRLIFQRSGISNVQERIAELSAAQRQQIWTVLSDSIAADYSCGVGRFLRAYLTESLNLASSIISKDGESSQKLGRTIVKRLVGIDVDYVALEIAKLTLLSDVNAFELYDQISNNFVFGNPLIHRPEKASFDVARSAFQMGVLYSVDLGLNLYTDIVSADIILGNPPWERIRLEERSFFFSFDPEISACTKKNTRQQLIARLGTKAPALYSRYCQARDTYVQAKTLISNHPYFFHSAHGELNTYALFTELAINKRNQQGVVGLLVKTGLVSTVANQRIFRHINDKQYLVSISDFINMGGIFAIDSRERFCYLLLGDNKAQSFKYGGLFVHATELSDHNRYWDFPFAALDMLNVDTGMLPNLADPVELKFLLSLHERNPSFKDVYPDAKFGRLVHFTNHANDIRPVGGTNYIAIYEGKFIEQYDGRFATFEGVSEENRHAPKARARPLSQSEKKNRRAAPMARYYVSTSRWHSLSREYTAPYSLMWRSLTSPTNRRTCIATILPHLPTSQSIQFLQLKDAKSLALLLAIVNSTTFDYIIRRKLSGIDLTQTIIKQTPVPHPRVFGRRVTVAGTEGTLEDHMLVRICALLGDDARLDQFRKLVCSQTELEETSRKTLQSELDVLVATCYGLTSEEYGRVLNGFSDLGDSNLENRDTLLRWFSEDCIVQN